MKLIKQTTLHFQDSKSDKIYEVDLCEVTGNAFLVNFRYGKRDGNLREGTKTDLPVTRAEADKIFDKLVSSKTKKGYLPLGETAPIITPELNENKPEPTAETPGESASWVLDPEHREAFLNALQKAVTPKTKSSIFKPKQPTSEDQKTNEPKRGIWALLKGLTGIGNNEPERRFATQTRQDSPQSSQPKNESSSKLSRLIWRAGELQIPEALPILMNVETNGDSLTNYSLAWSLGRFGNKEALPKLDVLAERALRSKDRALLRITTAAKFACADEIDRRTGANLLLEDLPAKIKSAIRAGNHGAIGSGMAEFCNNENYPDLFADLYLIAEFYPSLSATLLDWAGRVPFKGSGYFRSIRQIYKLAELREDPEMLGLLAYRFQKQMQSVENVKWGHTQIDGEYVQNREEIKKPKSRLAYSKATKEYFTRRAARMLRRKGEIADPEYVKIAVGMLLQFTDADRAEPVVNTFYRYDYSDSNWTQHEYKIIKSEYHRFHVFNEVLFKNSPRYKRGSGITWVYDETAFEQKTIPTQREEAFPELWDKRPEGLLHLLAESQNETVHEFAVKTAKANFGRILNLVDADFIKLIFNKKYLLTLRLGLELAKAKYNPSNPDFELIDLLLQSPLEEARTTGIEWLNDCKNAFLKDSEYIVSLIFNPYLEVGEWLEKNISPVVANDKLSYVVIGRSISEMMLLGATSEPDSKERILAGGDRLTGHFNRHLRKASLDLINELLNHPMPEVRVFGAKILLDHETPVSELPEDLLLGLINGDTPELRSVGVQLLGKLPQEDLVKKENLLLGLCLSPFAETRQTVKPVIANLAEKNGDFTAAIIKKLAARLLRKEPHEGVDEDLLDLLTVHLKNHLSVVPKNITLNLLFSPRKAAHELGNHLLREYVDFGDLTMRQIVRLGDNEMIAVREQVWGVYEKNTPRIKYEAREAVRLLDSKREDSRDFSIQFFRENFDKNDWEPEVLVSICDSVNPLVQQFGKELITKFFDEENGEQYLLQLSQHPTAELQQFATNYLERFASDKPENIEQLRHYFTTVLSAINKSRVAKKRIFNFLKNEGLKSERTAKLVAEVMTRQSATMAITDKARCIEIMRDLEVIYPDLKMPIETSDYEIYALK